MSIPEEKLTLIQFDFETGFLSREEIAQRHGISTKTIYNYSHQLGWKYGFKKEETRRETNKLVCKRLLEERGDLALELTGRYLDGSQKLMDLVMGTTKSLEMIQDRDVAMTKKEQDQLQVFLRSLKLASETLNQIFLGQKKALGLEECKKIEQTTKIRQTGVLVVPGLAGDVEQWQRETVIQQQKIFSSEE